MNISTFHASCVAFGNKAVLIRGKPGSGKSDLVLRLIDTKGFGINQKPLHAKLVADDQVELIRVEHRIYVSPPKTLAGMLEVRGWGIMTLPHKARAILHLVVDLGSHAEIPRMPEPAERSIEILGLPFQRLWVDPASASAAARIRALIS